MTTRIRKNTETGTGLRARSAVEVVPGKKGIDRQQVLEAARAICNEQGIDGLSIKEVADRLGIRPPSVYAHFDGLTGIRSDLAKWGHGALATQLRNSAIGLGGKVALVAVAKAYLDFIRKEPGLYSATITRSAITEAEPREAAREWLSVLQQLLESLGLSEEDRIHALRGIRSIVHGFGQLEASGQFRTEVDRDVSFSRMLATFIEAITRQKPKHG